jgi:hypothetical protein
MSSPLNTPFKSDPFSPPGAHENEDTSGMAPDCVNNPSDVSVLGFVFYQKDLKGSPAALATPMGTAIPGIGHGFPGTGTK